MLHLDEEHHTADERDAADDGGDDAVHDDVDRPEMPGGVSEGSYECSRPSRNRFLSCPWVKEMSLGAEGSEDFCIFRREAKGAAP